MSLLAVFQWLENSGLGATIRESLVLFPIIESLHLLGLAVIGGAILLVDMRLVGLGLRGQPVGRLERDARPWLIGSLVVMIVTGGLLFASEAMKCYYSLPFWVKIASLALAILFTFTVRRRVAQADGAAARPLRNRLTAVISLALWGGVAWGGRWIGFS